MSLRFITAKESIDATLQRDITLARLIVEAGLPLDTRCGGKGCCTGCVVKLLDGEFLIDGKPVAVRPPAVRKVQSCCTYVTSSDARIEIPPRSLTSPAANIVDDFLVGPGGEAVAFRKYCVQVPEASLESPVSDWDRLQAALQSRYDLQDLAIPLPVLRTLPEALREPEHRLTVTLFQDDTRAQVVRIEAGDTTVCQYAAAVDIGTTTVVVLLLDLAHGAVLGRASALNRQTAMADDVASRISLCESPQSLAQLQRLIVAKTINPLLREVCAAHDIDPVQLDCLYVAGNTVMIHLFLGLSPAGIGVIPFQPVTHAAPPCLAADCGAALHAGAIIAHVPSIHGYVGGDITSDIYVAGLHEGAETQLLLDIGTNCEIVLRHQDRLTGCATPAGPAFEGGGLLHGCRATAGAIDCVTITGQDLQWTTIGGEPPVGICGSGIIDFIAEACKARLLNTAGRYDIDQLRQMHRYVALPNGTNTQHACLLASAPDDNSEDIVISEADIAAILQAKAAVYSGLLTLLELNHVPVDAIDRLVLAGGFARHIHIPNAITLGLLPDIPLTRIEVIGNGSLAGAMLALTDKDAIPAFGAIAASTEVVELNTIPAFEHNYIDALFLPMHRHTAPTVQF